MVSVWARCHMLSSALLQALAVLAPAAHSLVVPCGAIGAAEPWADCVLNTTQAFGPLPHTNVTFTTADPHLQALAGA